MTRLDAWVSISRDRDPASKVRRLRNVERIVRARNVEKAGGSPCPVCGGGDPVSGVEDVCRCGTGEAGNAAWTRCVTNAAKAPLAAPEDGEDVITERYDRDLWGDQ